MQDWQISDDGKRIDSDRQFGIYADKQANISENKQNSNTTDLGLSPVLGLLTPDINSNNTQDEQIPMKKKIKKKAKRGLRR